MSSEINSCNGCMWALRYGSSPPIQTGCIIDKLKIFGNKAKEKLLSQEEGTYFYFDNAICPYKRTYKWRNLNQDKDIQDLKELVEKEYKDLSIYDLYIYSGTSFNQDNIDKTIQSTLNVKSKPNKITIILEDDINKAKELNRHISEKFKGLNYSLEIVNSIFLENQEDRKRAAIDIAVVKTKSLYYVTIEEGNELNDVGEKLKYFAIEKFEPPIYIGNVVDLNNRAFKFDMHMWLGGNKQGDVILKFLEAKEESENESRNTTNNIQ